MSVGGQTDLPTGGHPDVPADGHLNAEGGRPMVHSRVDLIGASGQPASTAPSVRRMADVFEVRRNFRAGHLASMSTRWSLAVGGRSTVIGASGGGLRSAERDGGRVGSATSRRSGGTHDRVDQGDQFRDAVGLVGQVPAVGRLPAETFASALD